LTNCPKKSAFATFQPLRERILSVYESFISLLSESETKFQKKHIDIEIQAKQIKIVINQELKLTKR
jgi:hypothetical protein